MKIAILYLYTGIGHYRESLAIKKSIKNSLPGSKVTILSPIAQIKKSRSFRSQLFYKFYKIFIKVFVLFNHMPSIWVSKSSSNNNNKSVRRFIVKNFFKYARNFEKIFIRQIQQKCSIDKYDLVISTHPIASGLLFDSNKSKYWNVCPDEVTVVTAEFYRSPGYVNFVNSKQVRNQMQDLSKGERDHTTIKIVGHPLDPDIYKNRHKIYDRIQTDHGRSRLSLGLYIGGFGPSYQKRALLEIIENLSVSDLNLPLELHVLTGNHNDFELELDKILSNKVMVNKVKVYKTRTKNQLVEIGHDLLKNEINVMFSRPSELVFYSIATGIPHITFKPLGPQEVDMFNLINSVAGCPSYNDIKNDLVGYLSNKQQLISISKNLFKYNYNLRGADNIAKMIARSHEE